MPKVKEKNLPILGICPPPKQKSKISVCVTVYSNPLVNLVPTSDLNVKLNQVSPAPTGQPPLTVDPSKKSSLAVTPPFPPVFPLHGLPQARTLDILH